MPVILTKIRAFLERSGSRWVLLTGTVLLLALVLTTIRLAVLPQQEAAGQKAEISPPAVELPIAPAPITLPKAPTPEPTRGITPGTGSRGIPGLSEMDVIGNLQYIPGTNFRCPGGGPDKGLYKRVCKSPSDDGSASYEVTLVEENPGVVRSVEATAYDASDDDAAEFLVSVAKLSLEDIQPINPETWVTGNISSGGSYLAGGAQLKLYGAEGARTLEVVATGPLTDRDRR